MVDCFSQRKPGTGLCCLKKATEKDHVEAMDVYSIIVSGVSLEHYSKRSSKIITSCYSNRQVLEQHVGACCVE